MASGGFKQFVLRGNVVDLAVGVVMGAAFGTVVSGFVKDLLTPLIAAIVGKPDFSALKFTINGSQFLFGDFVNAVIAFVLVAAAVYYFVVLPVNALIARAKKEPPADHQLSLSVSLRGGQCAGYGVQSGHLRNFDTADNQAFFAIADRSPSLLTMPVG